jgi:mannosyltransferase
VIAAELLCTEHFCPTTALEYGRLVPRHTEGYNMVTGRGSPGSPSKPGLPTWIFAAVACGIAAALALLRIDSKSFWLDEASSVHIADPHLGLRSVALVDGGNFALYYVLLHGWLRLGMSDAFVRFLSVIPAVLAVAAVFTLGRRLWGVRAGAIAASILAINPFFITYAQEARGYSLLVLASIVATLFFVRSIEDPKSWFNPVAYVVTSVLMVYTHLFGIFVLAAHVVALSYLRRPVKWRAVPAASAIVVLLLPLAYVAHRKGMEGISWIPPLSMSAVMSSFVAFAGGMPLLLLYAVIAGYAIVQSLPRQVQPDPRVPWMALILAWLFVPNGLAAIVSLLVTPIFVTRYLIITLPPLVLFAAAMIARIRQPAILATVWSLFVAGSAFGLWHYYFFEPKEDWRGVAAFVNSYAASGDVVVLLPPWLDIPLRHAVDHLPDVRQFPDFEDTRAFNPGHTAYLHPDAAPALAASFAQHPRVWLIQSCTGCAQRFVGVLAEQRSIVVHALDESKRLSLTRSFDGVALRLYVKAQNSKTPH